MGIENMPDMDPDNRHSNPPNVLLLGGAEKRSYLRTSSADTPPVGSSLMSSGPSAMKLKPRLGVSSWTATQVGGIRTLNRE